MDAAERAKYITHWYADDRIIGVRPELLYDKCLAQIRQAEQAARLDEREKVLEEAAAQCNIQGLVDDRERHEASVDVRSWNKAVVACRDAVLALKET